MSAHIGISNEIKL